MNDPERRVRAIGAVHDDERAVLIFGGNAESRRNGALKLEILFE
jgi:hypothetical protein